MGCDALEKSGTVAVRNFKTMHFAAVTTLHTLRGRRIELILIGPREDAHVVALTIQADRHRLISEPSMSPSTLGNGAASSLFAPDFQGNRFRK